MADDAALGTLAPAPEPEFSCETPRPAKAPLSALDEPVPLFAQPERSFATAARIDAITPVPGGARVAVRTDGDQDAELLVQRTRSGALRLRWSFPPGAAGTVRDGDAMLGDGADPDPTAAAHIDPDHGGLTLTAPTWRFVLDATMSWRLERHDGSLLTRQRRDDRAFPHWMSRPLGTSGGPALRTWSHESLHLDPDERLYGLGQQYGGLDKRGTRLVQHNRDALGSNGTLLTYQNTPFCWSSAGYGIVVHAAGRVMWEIGNPSFETLTVAAAGDVLDIFLLTGDTPQALLDSFYALAGPPGTVPDWALGIWMSRCQYRSRAEVTEVAQRLDAIGFPYDVLHLDPRWMRPRREADNDHGADFTWDAEQFGDARAFFAWAREEARVRVSLWENPYALAGSWTHAELSAIDGLALLPDGTPAAPFESPRGQSFVVDFTDEDVRRWWTAQHHRLLDLGASAFKTDFAEGVPDDAIFADGRTGADIHNLYALLFNRLVYDAVAGRGEAPFVYGRSGWLGSHRHPLQWSGDAQCTWSDMRGALRAGLSAALSGTAYWASDIGGFYTLDDPLPDGELYARWTWLGCLSPIARFHGTSPREPYVYAAEVCDAAVAAARLRYALMPYLAEHSRRAPGGRPLMRPLLLAFPDDPLCWRDGSSFLLGDDLLVAPVLQPGGARRVHLPAGRWGDWWTGEVVTGPIDIDVVVPLDRVPLYQREASAVPLGAGARVEEVLAGPLRRKLWNQPYAAPPVG
jgi:alpha-D-xyloside xylohydrolase